MSTLNHLTFEEQLALFKSRGMRVDESRDVEKLKSISYYKLKQFAEPFSSLDEHNNLVYDNISFSDILARYYQDKNLRLKLLHAIEKIEVALKTRLSHELGKRYGAFGYLDYRNWANMQKATREKLEKQHNQIKAHILTKVRRPDTFDLSKSVNKNEVGFPNVWIAVDFLTLGELVCWLEHLNDACIRPIAGYFGITIKELLSWVKCIRFIRNVIAHNHNLIDIKMITKPKMRKEWKSYLLYSNAPARVAIVFFVVHTMVSTIDPCYKWKYIRSIIDNIINRDTQRANLLGFTDSNSWHEVLR